MWAVSRICRVYFDGAGVFGRCAHQGVVVAPLVARQAHGLALRLAAGDFDCERGGCFSHEGAGNARGLFRASHDLVRHGLWGAAYGAAQFGAESVENAVHIHGRLHLRLCDINDVTSLRLGVALLSLAPLTVACTATPAKPIFHRTLCFFFFLKLYATACPPQTQQVAIVISAKIKQHPWI